MRNFPMHLVVLLWSSIVLASVPAASEEPASAQSEQVFSSLALQCIHQEYPNLIKHKMNRAEDLRAPSELYPAFYGCLDWHSSVHGHWLLVRMLNTAGNRVDRERIIASLERSFSADNLAGELSSYTREGNVSFERPYGLAWYLQLMTELRESSLPQAGPWVTTLEPLEAAITDTLTTWLHKLAYPIRTGEHSQTAFALGLMLDWSRQSRNTAFKALLTEKVKQYYLEDTQCPIAYEPSGQDFLSPCLAEADLLRRVLTTDEYSRWLTGFLPGLADGDEDWITPATVVDKSDGKLAHLDGLNLSRAWMLEGIISGLAPGDKRIALLEASRQAHRDAGLNAVLGELHYMGSHWLGSFATYLETRRGIAQ